MRVQIVTDTSALTNGRFFFIVFLNYNKKIKTEFDFSFPFFFFFLIHFFSLFSFFVFVFRISLHIFIAILSIRSIANDREVSMAFTHYFFGSPLFRTSLLRDTNSHLLSSRHVQIPFHPTYTR